MNSWYYVVEMHKINGTWSDKTSLIAHTLLQVYSGWSPTSFPNKGKHKILMFVGKLSTNEAQHKVSISTFSNIMVALAVYKIQNVYLKLHSSSKHYTS